MKLEILAAQVEALETAQAVTFPIGGKIKPNILRCYSLLHLSNSKLLHIHPILANSIYSSSKVLEPKKRTNTSYYRLTRATFHVGLQENLPVPRRERPSTAESFLLTPYRLVFLLLLLLAGSHPLSSNRNHVLGLSCFFRLPNDEPHVVYRAGIPSDPAPTG